MTVTRNERAKKSFAFAALILRASVRSFLKNNNFEMSAALSSYGFFSLIPLLFFVLYVFGYYANSSEIAMKGIENLTAHMLPELNRIIIKEMEFLTKYRSVWGFLGLLLLLSSLVPFADTLRTAFAQIFKTHKEGSFLKAQVLNLITVLIILLFSGAAVLFETAYSQAVQGLLQNMPLLLAATDFIISLAILVLFVLVFYVMYLPEKVGIIPLFVSSLTTAALLIILRHLFSWFLAHNPDYGMAFGSLKTIFVIMGWIYCSFLIILFGAELMVNMAKRDALLLARLFADTSPFHRGSRRLLEKFIRDYPPGEVIVSEGDVGKIMFSILSGSVNVRKKGQAIRVFGEGEYFGEMSMLLNAPRTATVVAGEAGAEVIVISDRNFDLILRDNPAIVLSILKEMAMRLKTTGDQETKP
jgi:membrane protein